MIKKLFLLLFLPFSVFSQHPTKCGTPFYINNQSSFFKEAVNNSFMNAKEWVNNNRKKLSTDSILNVPVVVHIIHENSIENLDDSLVYSQIEVLNRDFSRSNSDTVNMRSVFDTIAAPASIQFYLATIDPNGNPTNGITRTFTNESSFIDFNLTLDLMKDDATGGVDAWPVEKYLNIWVCDLSFNVFGQSIPAILGYAYPPAGLSNWPQGSSPTNPNFDGVVIHYEVFGRNNPYSSVNQLGTTISANMGRTCVHEVGHYLGLRHVWGDGDCSADDGLLDTPIAIDQSQFDCDSTKNSCVDFSYDFPDMIENYMDYSSEECQNTFTRDQVDLMYAVLINDRYDLINNNMISTNVETNLEYINISFLPNPVSDFVQISLVTQKKVNNLEIKLIDISGRVLLKKNNKNIYGNHKIKLDVKNIKTGVYFLQTNIDEKINTSTIVIQ